MHFLVELMDEYTLIRCTSALEAQIALEARDLFNDIIEHADRNVVLDLSLSPHVDSSGLGAIVYLFKRIHSLGFQLYLVGLQTQPFDLMHSLGVNRVIRSYPLNPSSQASIKEHHPI